MLVVGLLIILIALIVPIAIVVLIISAVMKRNKEDKVSFEESMRGLYVYVVLIISLITIISGVITTFRVGLDLILPEKSQSSNYSEEQVRNENIIELTTTISLVAITIPIFVYHNKIAKMAKEAKKEEMKNNKD